MVNYNQTTISFLSTERGDLPCTKTFACKPSVCFSGQSVRMIFPLFILILPMESMWNIWNTIQMNLWKCAKSFSYRPAKNGVKNFPAVMCLLSYRTIDILARFLSTLKMKLLQSENLDGSFTEITAIKDMPQKLRRRFSVFAKTHSILIKSLPAVTAETLHP